VGGRMRALLPPDTGHGFLILEVSTSHMMTHHSW